MARKIIVQLQNINVTKFLQTKTYNVKMAEIILTN
jgi:hypothetical protein